MNVLCKVFVKLLLVRMSLKKFILVLPAEPALKPATASSKMTLAIKQSSSGKKPMGSLWALLSTTQLLTEAFAVYWIECSS